MPIIQGPHVTLASAEFNHWGLANFRKGDVNVTEPHYHDCDEYVFMIEGKMKMRSEGVVYVLEPHDLLVTRMGDKHEVLEILEDTTYFWLEGELRGEKRWGHLHD